MPPPLPDRYRLEVRLGRDGDVEEWLATDTSLDRPVLVRILGPDADPLRRQRFLAAVGAASAVNHSHLAAVYTAGELPDGAYSVSEWAGGMTVADRLESDETVDPDEFLPNAAGLASALAALHSEGVVHGAIDTRAIFYAVAHPAKLGAFGRPARDRSAIDDVRSLARALETALTGAAPGGPPPSEVIDGLSPTVDSALRRAQVGMLTAKALADELSASPSPVPPRSEPPGWSRRLLVAAAALVLAAAGLVALGRLFLAGSGSPIILPATTVPTDRPLLPTTTSSVPTDVSGTEPEPLEIVGARAFDPFGDGREHDDRIANLLDGDLTTTWRTETYLDPLPLIKPGVGIVFVVAGTPRTLRVAGITPGVSYLVAWSEADPPSPETWERVTTGTTTGEALDLSLPSRTGGRWVLWLTDLPERDLDDHSAQIAEVRFRQ